MHIITRKRLLEFAQKHPNSGRALDHWYRTIKRGHYRSLASLRQTFPSADQVGKFTVFNIGGNTIRLIAAIHYNTGCLYVRHVLTHSEYDLGNWKE